MANPVTAYAPFPSPDVRLLRNDEFSLVLSFLGPKELACIERVCISWKKFIEDTKQWEKQCQYLFGINANIDSMTFLPKGSSYKEGIRLVLSRIFDQDTYRYYLGAEIGPVPPIPEEISLKRFNEPDPCEPTETIGQNYFWMFIPSHFEINGNTPFFLIKANDPHDPEAVMLIHKKETIIESIIRKNNCDAESKNKVLNVPNTIYNSEELFKHPKNGNSSAYNYAWPPILYHHGNKRISSGWICMREDPIGRNLSFSEQQAAASKAGVVISPLPHRIMFNFLKKVSSGNANAYPDEKDPSSMFARTATLVSDSQGTTWSVGCRAGPNGLQLQPTIAANRDIFTAAVALPTKV